MKRVIRSSLQNIEAMARVGFTSDRYEVYVNTNDGGKIPHFHYRDANDWNKFYTCICIDRPEYFHHDGKSDVLNSKQKRALQKFMESKVSLNRYKDKFSNNWELICFMWDINNSDIQIDDIIQQPNYINLPD